MGDIATQTAIVRTLWGALEEDGRVLERRDTGPVRLHCAFRFEAEHLLARAGLAVEALYGDFHGSPLEDGSPEMIWVARSQKPGP